MAKKRTGTVVMQSGSYRLRITLPDGKRKWIALRTTDRREAEQRASMLAGWQAVAGNTERDWLASLVELGEWARQRMEGVVGSVEISLEGAWEAFEAGCTAGAGTMRAYKGAWRNFEAWAIDNGITQAGEINRVIVSRYAAELSKRKLAAGGRALDVVRRVVVAAGGDGGAFEGVVVREGAGSRYRRLAIGEVLEVWRAARLRVATRSAERSGEMGRG